MAGLRRFVTALAGAAILASMLAVPAAAGTVTRFVDDDGLAGPNGCGGSSLVPKRLQPAINASSPGDIIRVCPGTYTGWVTITKNGLRILPASSGAVTLKPPADRTKGWVVFISADGVTLRGLRILAPAGPITADECDLRSVTGIRIESGKNIVLRNNRITGDESATSWYCGLEWGISANGKTGTIAGNTIRNFVNTGLDIYGATGLTVTDNLIQHVRPEAGESRSIRGVVIYGSTVTMTDTTIETVAGTSDQIDEGITVDYGAKVTLQRNTVTRASTGLLITGTGDGLIEENTIQGGSGDGVLVTSASGAPTSPSVVLRRNVVTGFAGRGIFSQGSSGMAIRYNDFSGNGSVDCQDYTVPSEHTWVGNKSSEESDPVGLCAPENAGPG